MTCFGEYIYMYTLYYLHIHLFFFLKRRKTFSIGQSSLDVSSFVVSRIREDLSPAILYCQISISGHHLNCFVCL